MIKQFANSEAQRLNLLMEQTGKALVAITSLYSHHDEKAQRVVTKLQTRYNKLSRRIVDMGFVIVPTYVLAPRGEKMASLPEHLLGKLVEIAQDNTEEAYNRTIEETGKNPTYPKAVRLIKAYTDEMALISEIKQAFWGDGEIKTAAVTCTWTQDKWADYNPWSTACGGEFEITNGSPSENEMNFCPYCARRIVEVITDSLSDGEGEDDEQEQ